MILRFLKSLFLIDLMKGMWLTLKYTPQPAFTFQYPAERRPTAPRSPPVVRRATGAVKRSGGGGFLEGGADAADVVGSDHDPRTRLA